MGAIREYSCIIHGEFECSVPICPAHGCDSSAVTQEFRTPVTIGSQFRKRFDQGMRKSADMYGIDNWKSAKAGDTSFAGRAPVGQELLWGDGCKKVMGRSFAELTGIAQKPLVVNKRDGGQVVLDRNNGMREAATEAGITRRRLPKAGEVTAFKGEKGADVKAQALTV